MLLTGWDSAGGITPPASSSSSVVLTSIVLFFIYICRLWLISFSYVCFVSSRRGIRDFLVSGRCTVIYCHISVCWIVCVFCQTGTLDWMVVMAVDSWWLGYVMLSSVLLLPCTVIICFLSSQISGILFLDFQDLQVTLLIYTVCVCVCGFHVCAALRRRRSRRSWRLGKLCTTPGLNPLGPESFAGIVVLTVGSWRARRYCTVPETQWCLWLRNNAVFISLLIYSTDTLTFHLVKS